MIKTVILDLDGPLLDGKLRHYRCYADILAAHDYNPMPIDTYWKMKRMRKSRAEQLTVTGAEAIYDLFLNEWLTCIEKPEYLALDRVQHGAINQLSSWKKEGLDVILVTMRSSRKRLIEQLQQTDLLPFFLRLLTANMLTAGLVRLWNYYVITQTLKLRLLYGLVIPRLILKPQRT